MKIFKKYFKSDTSLNHVDKYIRSVLKTFNPDDDVEISYQDESIQIKMVPKVSYGS